MEKDKGEETTERNTEINKLIADIGQSIFSGGKLNLEALGDFRGIAEQWLSKLQTEDEGAGGVPVIPTEILRIFNRVVRRISESLDMKSLLDVLIDVLVTECNAALARIWLIEGWDTPHCNKCQLSGSCETKGRCLHLKASGGPSSDILEKTPYEVPLGNCTIGSIAQSGSEIVCNDIQNDHDIQYGVGDLTAKRIQGETYREWIEKEKIISFAAHPLKLRGEIIGVMEIFSKEVINDDFLEILRLFSQHAAVNINRARLYEESMQRARDIEILNEELRKNAVELEKKNRELEEQNRKVVETTRLKSEFLANTSHELRTPLNTIIGFSSILLAETPGKLNEEQKRQVNFILSSGEHLLSLINEVLDLSKIEAGKFELSCHEYDLKEVISEVVANVRSAVVEKNVGIETLLPDDFPLVYGDKKRVKQILINLVGNAVKFTEEGKIKIEVCLPCRHRQARTGNISARTTPPSLMERRAAFRVTSPDLKVSQKLTGQNIFQIIVSDTGMGISEEELPHIFEEFRQVDGSHTRKQGGTGLGLAIVKKMVELHGGEIEVESKLGEGSTFTVTLPLSFAHPGASVKQDKKNEHQNGTSRNSVSSSNSKPTSSEYNKIILTIDDDPAAAEIIRSHLIEHGYQQVVCNGNGALEKAKAVNPLAITLDVLIPGKDGWEILQELKRDPQTKHIPVIIISIIEDENYGFSLGAAEYLTKPFEKDSLLNCIKELENLIFQKEVLIVDDDWPTVELIGSTLEAAGYHVLRSYSGSEALKQLSQRRPSAIILDLMMPEMDGFEVIERLKADKETRSIPVIVLTAKDLTPNDRLRLRNKVEKITQKGLFTQEEVIAELKSFLDNLIRSHAHT